MVKRWWAIGLVIWLTGCVGDPIYHLSVDSLRLPIATPPSHALYVAGVPSVYPVLQHLTLRRPAGLPAAKVVLFATLKMPKAETLQQVQPMPLAAYQAKGLPVTAEGDLPNLGRFACYADWADNETETECVVDNLAVLNQGWFLYAIATPTPTWIDVTLTFERTGIPEPPLVQVKDID